LSFPGWILSFRPKLMAILETDSHPLEIDGKKRHGFGKNVA